jgi:hypothetical protein
MNLPTFREFKKVKNCQTFHETVTKHVNFTFLVKENFSLYTPLTGKKEFNSWNLIFKNYEKICLQIVGFFIVFKLNDQSLEGSILERIMIILH